MKLSNPLHLTIVDIINDSHCNKSCVSIRSMIAADPTRIDELMQCFFSEDLRLCQRSAWAVEDIAKKNPVLLNPYFPEMLKRLDYPQHNAFVRNTVRTWQNMEIPEAYMGEIFERCFSYISDPKEAIAVRAFSITICENISKIFPELNEELQLLLRDILSYETSPGVLSRVKRTIRR